MASLETKLAMVNALRATRPPYECPLCSRMYRSISGVNYHIMKFDHENPPEGYDPNCTSIRPSLQTPKIPSGVDCSPTRPSRRVNLITLESPSRHKRQPLTYAEAQRMVEFDLNGEMLRTLIADDLPLEKEVEKVVEDTPVTPIKQVFTPRHYKSKLKFTRRKSKISQKKDAEKGDSLPRVSLPLPSFRERDSFEFIDRGPRPTAYFRFIEKSAEELDEEVEYDMDEEDYAWLETVNEDRKEEGSSVLSQEVFEMLMDRLEKESHFETQTVNGDPYNLIDEDAVCCICNDGECSNSNVILFCDMCNLAVHQECYGVPYIPEGQWLCKRCLQSPSKPVDCVLCPNKSGAFKQTDDNRWAHVVCALWIPEVCFANTVFLEPVDSIQNIPPARWKLVCYICKKREGACIQCFKTNCYIAFHVTCAAQASLHMKMEPSRTESGQPSVKKTAFCDIHTPKNSDGTSAGSDNESEMSLDWKLTLPKKKPAQCQSPEEKPTLAETPKCAIEKPNSRPPIVHIPFVPPHRLSKIASRVAISRKAQFIQMLQSYWMLKRQSRNGVPLLRRLQAISNGISRNHKEELEASDQARALKEQLKYWQQLRHDLERARLLVELIRKREKIKREQYKVQQHITSLQMQPMNFLLRRTLDSLQSKDTSDIFAEPVNIDEVPDYLDHIDQPMDFSAMRSKVMNHEYLNFDQFENDFYLMLSNCMSYNEKDTIYYKAAAIMKNVGRPILKAARKKMQIAGIDPETGLHGDKVLLQSEGLSDEDLMSNEGREMTLEERLKDLEEKLELTATVKSSAARASRQKMLRREIGTVKRKMKKRDRQLFSPQDLSENTDNEGARKRTMSQSSEDATAENMENKKSKPELKEEPLAASPQDTSFSPPSTPIPANNAVANPSPGRSRRSGILFNKGFGRSNGSTVIPLPIGLTVSSESEEGNPLKSPDNIRPLNGIINNNLERHLYLDPAKINELFSQRETPRIPFHPVHSGHRLTNDRIRSFSHESMNEFHRNDLDKEEQPDVHGNSFKSHNGFQETFSETSSEDVIENTKSVDSIDNHFYHGYSSHQTEPINRKRTYTSSSANSDSEGPGRRRFGHKRGRKPLKKVYSFSEDFSCIDMEDMQSGVYMIGTDDVANKSLRDPKQDPEMLYPMDLVWAKCRGYPAYPAMIVDPSMPRGFFHHGVPIPVPPIEVLNMRNDYEDYEDRYLVLFFDLRRTWQWLTRCKLEPLGVDSRLDKVKLIEGRKISMRKSVRQAYERALLHRKRVQRNYSDNEIDSESSIDGPS